MPNPTVTDPRARRDPAPPPRGAVARLRRHLSTLPTQLTALRLGMVPGLWALALLDRPVWLGIGVMAAGATDVLDGYLSRRWGQTSVFGSRLDSAADHVLATSMTLWLVMLRPFFFHEQKWPLIAWSAFALFVLAVSWLKFRRFVDLHLWSAKLAVFLAFAFGIPLLVLGAYSRVHFWVSFGVACFAAAEALYVILTRDTIDEHIGSVLLPRR